MAERRTRRVRAVGLDLGERRVGVAVSDSQGRLAVPERTVVRTGDEASDLVALVEVVVELEAERVVVGLPLGLDGRAGRAAKTVSAQAASLADALAPRGIEVEMFDERLTTVSAERALADAGMGGKARRRVVDSAAASTLLQAWLDARRSQER